MATITGYNAARMLQIENESIVDGNIVAGELILLTREGTPINAGPVVSAGGTPFVGQYTTGTRPSAVGMTNKILWDYTLAGFFKSNGTIWETVELGGGGGGGPSTASALPFVPAGGISATDTQAAVLEARADSIARANHTGFQPASTISDFSTAVFAAGAAADTDLQALIDDFNDLVTVSGNASQGIEVSAGGQIQMTDAAWEAAVPVTSVATSDVTKTSDVTFANDSEIVVAVEASKVYEFEYVLYFEADITEDINVQFTAPAGATAFFSVIGSSISQGAAGHGTATYNARQYTLSDAASVGGTGIGTVLAARFRGVLTVSTTAGNFRPQWCQRLTGAIGTIRKTGSRLTIRRIA